jgi:hypothetical protein
VFPSCRESASFRPRVRQNALLLPRARVYLKTLLITRLVKEVAAVKRHVLAFRNQVSLERRAALGIKTASEW